MLLLQIQYFEGLYTSIEEGAASNSIEDSERQVYWLGMFYNVLNIDTQ